MDREKDVGSLVERRVGVVEDKLRNSFASVRRDIEELKGAVSNDKIDELNKKVGEIGEAVKKCNSAIVEGCNSGGVEGDKERERLEGEVLELRLGLERERQRVEFERERVKYLGEISGLRERLKESGDLRRARRVYEKRLVGFSKEYERRLREISRGYEKKMKSLESRMKNVESRGNDYAEGAEKVRRELDSRMKSVESRIGEVEGLGDNYIEITEKTQRFAEGVRRELEGRMKGLERRNEEVEREIGRLGKKCKGARVEECKGEGVGGKERGVGSRGYGVGSWVRSLVSRGEGVVKVLAFVVPVCILFYFLYVNFLPFGFEEEYVVSVVDGVVVSSSSGVWLENGNGNKVENVSGVVGELSLVVDSGVVLDGASVFVEVSAAEGSTSSNTSVPSENLRRAGSDDVYFNKIGDVGGVGGWDYFWNFSEGVPGELLGSAEYSEGEGCVYFDALEEDTLEYPDSYNMFEMGSFVVYARWRPDDEVGANQQVIGHYNWELFQDEDNVRFVVGRMDDENGPFYSVYYEVNESFFGEEHEAVGVYRVDDEVGYIELYVDGEFAERKEFGNSSIWRDYNKEKDLSFGWDTYNHGENSYFSGCLYGVGFDYGEVEHLQSYDFVLEQGSSFRVPFVLEGNLNSISAYVVK